MNKIIPNDFISGTTTLYLIVLFDLGITHIHFVFVLIL